MGAVGTIYYIGLLGLTIYRKLATKKRHQDYSVMRHEKHSAQKRASFRHMQLTFTVLSASLAIGLHF